jgi:uncharacterized RDD family membrane protein YckC
MNALAEVQVEFRCNRCWHSNCADAELVGTAVACRNCGQSVTVPEATLERIERAAALSETQEYRTASPKINPFEHTPSDAELLAMARMESYVSPGEMDYSGHPTASFLPRFFAVIIDCVLIVLSILAGFLLNMWLAKLGVLDDPMAVIRGTGQFSNASLVTIYSIYALLVLGQWTLITLRGQTLGKMVAMIRVVSVSGRLPGFVQGVVLRNWLRNALAIIPFFSLIDALLVLTPSGRCLHDYIAGTRVVSNV